jgi:hypothetical protein
VENEHSRLNHRGFVFREPCFWRIPARFRADIAAPVFAGRNAGGLREKREKKL